MKLSEFKSKKRKMSRDLYWSIKPKTEYLDVDVGIDEFVEQAEKAGIYLEKVEIAKDLETLKGLSAVSDAWQKVLDLALKYETICITVES